jgi:DNA gyrase, A subunit
MRYTEARLSKIAMEMLADINKDTVDFVPNFDDTEKEPIILPARFPNLLVNGTTGIAVGMATNIPPHNLRETIDAIKLIIDNRIEQKETTIDDIVNIVKGPDFPTGAMILGKTGIREAYTTGRGKIKVRAISNIETLPNGKNRIIITELPYLVNKAKLIEKIAELVRDKKVDGITDLRDESNREGMRVVIELRRDVNPNIILNRLYKHTQLQDTFGVIMLSLVNNEPKILNIKQMLDYYLKHQEEVVTRRTLYDLNKAKERAHILEGLLKALDNIDEVIKIIRASENVAVARQSLMERFELSEAQSFAIVDMRLRALTGLEREKLEAEYAELMEKIKYYNEILSDNNKLLALIKEEISVVSEKYATDRKTIFGHDENMEDEDLIADEDTVVVMTNLGYIKRMSPDNFKSQNRGGKGIKGMQTIEDDFIEDIIITTTHKNIYFFTNMGRVYKIKAYKIPDASRIARGNAIINLLDLKPEEKISAIIAENNKKDLSYLFMATKHGIIKKLDINEVANIRRNGLKVINLLEDDELIEVKITSKDDDILLISKFGKCVRFSEKDLRNIGRNARGVKGAKLSKGDELIAMQTSSQGDELLTISEYGIGKRTNLSEYDTKHRNIQGVKCHNITEKTGNLIGAKLVDEDMDILIISSEGIIIRIGVKDISLSGRNTSGVKLIDINKENDVRVASIAKVRYKEEE